MSFVKAPRTAIRVLLLALWATTARTEPWTADTGLLIPGGGPNQALKEAFERFQAEDYDGALKGLKAAAAANPDLPPAQVMLAQRLAESKQPIAMRRALERAAAEEPSDPEAYVLLSDLALREGRLVEAELLCQRAHQVLEPFHRSARRRALLAPHVLSNLASVGEARENWHAALKHLDAWLEIQPNQPAAMLRRGQVVFRLGQTEEALKQFQAAAKLDQSVPPPAVVMARLYEQSGRHEEAVESIAAAVETASNDVKIRLAAAQWSMETGQYVEAQRQIDAVVEIIPDALEAKLFKGLIAMFQGDCAAAERNLEAALKQSPSSFAARNNLAIALAEQNDPAKRRRALEYAQANVRQYSHQADAYSTLGWVLFRLGRIDEAEPALRMASASGAIAADTAYFLARIELDRGHKAEARHLLRTALAGKGAFLLRKEAAELLRHAR